MKFNAKFGKILKLALPHIIDAVRSKQSGATVKQAVVQELKDAGHEFTAAQLKTARGQRIIGEVHAALTKANAALEAQIAGGK